MSGLLRRLLTPSHGRHSHALIHGKRTARLIVHIGRPPRTEPVVDPAMTQPFPIYETTYGETA